MSFHNVLLPVSLDYGSLAGPSHATIVQTTASGHEYRFTRQSQARRRFQPVKQLLTLDEIAALQAFILARRGSLYSWKLFDVTDHSTAADGKSAPSALDFPIGTGTGSSQRYQLLKLYDQLGPMPVVRPLVLPIPGTVLVAVNGVVTGSYSLDGAGGITLTATSGHIVTAGCQFYCQARFDEAVDAWAQVSADGPERWSLPNLGAIEVLDEAEFPQRKPYDGGRNWGVVGADISIAWGDGGLQIIQTAAAISVFLPAIQRAVDGQCVFTVICAPASTHNIQIRDDAGNAVGSPFGAGGGMRQLGITRSGASATWHIYGA